MCYISFSTGLYIVSGEPYAVKIARTVRWELNEGLSSYGCSLSRPNLLTTFITPICILSNWTDVNNNIKYFLISFLILETLQILVFVVLDLFLFYVFFESVLIPLFFIIIIWGGSENKYRAAFLLFLYTLAGSLFMLLAILYIYINTGTTDFLLLSLSDISFNYQKILWLAFFISFAVKTPLFPFHIWLFRAHAEAPLAGSIILAAVILKLASYGFMRVLIPFFPDATFYFLPLVQTISCITIIYASLSTLRQIDTKQLVAMSSVALNIGPLINIKKILIELMQQTICVKINITLNFLSTNILNIIECRLSYSHIFRLALQECISLVKILKNCLINPQNENLSQVNKVCLIITGLIFSEIKMFVIYIFFMIYLYSSPLWSDILFIYYLFSFPINIKDKQEIIEKEGEQEKKFFEWLAGLIDGDGYIYQRSNGLFSLIIIFDIRDKSTAEFIKNSLGGNLNIVNQSNAIRYKLHRYESLTSIFSKLNGLLRSKTRIEQFKSACFKYGIEYKETIQLEYDNAWFSGFFDSDGHISFNKTSGSIIIAVTQKNKDILDLLAFTYNGKVHSHSKNGGSFRFNISSKKDVLFILDNYFSRNPSRTIKQNRLLLIKDYYLLRAMKAHISPAGSDLNKKWENFIKYWKNI